MTDENRYKVALEKIAADHIGTLFPMSEEAIVNRQCQIAKEVLEQVAKERKL